MPIEHEITVSPKLKYPLRRTRTNRDIGTNEHKRIEQIGSHAKVFEETDKPKEAGEILNLGKLQIKRLLKSYRKLCVSCVKVLL